MRSKFDLKRNGSFWISISLVSAMNWLNKEPDFPKTCTLIMQPNLLLFQDQTIIGK